jgi:hypothetical protein
LHYLAAKVREQAAFVCGQSCNLKIRSASAGSGAERNFRTALGALGLS